MYSIQALIQAVKYKLFSYKVSLIYIYSQRFSKFVAGKSPCMYVYTKTKRPKAMTKHLTKKHNTLTCVSVCCDVLACVKVVNILCPNSASRGMHGDHFLIVIIPAVKYIDRDISNQYSKGTHRNH